MPYCKVERSIDIEVSKEVAFNFLRDFHNFRKFDPFSIMEQAVNFTTSDPSSGLNATHHWEGKITGSGEMTIIEESPNKDYLRMSLDFFVPKGKGNFAYYTIKEYQQDNKTMCTITWGFDAKFPWFLALAQGMMQKMMDKNLGPNYEIGLKKLAHELNNSYPELTIQHQGAVEKSTMQYAGFPFKGVAATDIPKQFEENIPKYMEFLQANNVSYGPMMAIYTMQDPKRHIFDGVIGSFVDNTPPTELKNAGGIEFGTLPARYYNVFSLEGEYESIGRTWGIALMGSSRFQSKSDKYSPHVEYYTKDDSEKADGQQVEMWVPISKDKFDSIYNK